ncbi:hypothetical protein CALVIDRAFT_558476 [Calocera viscosa TUFC12733]|uniref:RNI-like protein n=1 Tax=Calocera viscosa (strain TUFC12733) TaxID=1330018 RepID=A0A167GPW9_CALVF|nr:hypothetical protein CALVIDRAFT_558476 [Calocera viscosa TUFC12733]
MAVSSSSSSAASPASLPSTPSPSPAGPMPSTPDLTKVLIASSSASSAPSTPLSPIYRSPHRPLRSILRPPPPPPKNVFTSLTQNFLSLPSKLGLPSTPSPSPAPGAPAPPAAAAAEPPLPQGKKPLKRAHFRMPVLSVTYSISSSLPPCSPETSKSRIQAEEALRETLVTLRENVWSAERVEGFYRDCCRTREERPDERIVIAIKHGLNNKPRILDLSGITLSVYHAAAVADVLALNLRLAKVIFDGCDLDEQSLHPILHALLISASLPSLSLSNNPRLKPPAFSLLQTYLTRARRLTALDLSGIPLPPPCAQILVSVLARQEEQDAAETPLSPSMKGKGVRKEDWEVARLLLSEPWHEEGVDDGEGLITLRLDNCSLKPASLEILAHAIRPSQLCHLSLRSNRISASGAVALAVLMKDYPDTAFAPIVMAPALPSSHSQQSLVSLSNSLSQSPAPPPRLLPPRPPAPNTTATPNAPTTPTTTYAAYVPKVKRIQQQQAALLAQGKPPTLHPVPPLPASLQSTPRSTPSGSPRGSVSALPYNAAYYNNTYGYGYGGNSQNPRRSSPPIITSNDGGGITTRHAREEQPARGGGGGGEARGAGAGAGGAGGGGGGLPSPALLSSVRGLDDVPRLGKLRTVDLKGNDIRTGVTYIAQVLKRNRTLRVLNLAENRIDEKGLSALAEALKYNETLETLDLSGNPCCGPSLEGVTSLRMAFTVNRSLKRLFLSNTNLTSPAAIHLAEFIPESHTLLHLDLTRNDLDYAGILALAAGMRSNLTLRCLDLSIPPNDEQAARCSRDILQACIRNTEKAGRGGELLGKSEILHTLQGTDPDVAKAAAAKPAEDPRPLGKSEKERLKVVKLSEVEVVDCVGEICRGERDVGEDARQALVERLEEMIRAERAEDRLAQLLELMDGLTASARLSAKARQKAQGMNGDARGLGLNGLHASPSGSGSGSAAGSGPSTPVTNLSPPQVAPSPAEHALSPAFSITSGSDDEASDEEPLGAGVDPDPEELGRDIRPQVSFGSPAPAAAGSSSSSSSVPGPTGNGMPPTSPVEERSKYWVEEEGEVFRRGHALLTEEEMEERGERTDVDGDELRKELLEKEVKRPPPRTVPLPEEEPTPADEQNGLSFFPDQIRP